MSGIRSGSPSTTMTPSTAVKDIEEIMSSELAPITGATAAIAELPQIELPQAIRIDRRTGKPSARLMPKLAPSARMTIVTIAPSRTMPDAAIAPNVSEAPSSATATSSSCFAENAIPMQPAAIRLPDRADGDPEQDRDDDGFDIGVADEALFHGLHRHCGKRDEAAQRNSPAQRNRFRAHAAGGYDIVRGIDPVRHAKSFKERKLCARPSEMENIVSV